MKQPFTFSVRQPKFAGQWPQSQTVVPGTQTTRCYHVHLLLLLRSIHTCSLLQLRQ